MHTWTGRTALILRLTCALLAVSAALLAAVPASALSTRNADATRDAQQAATAVSSFRNELQGTLSRYLTAYGDRLTEAERARVTVLIAQADKDLAAVSTQAATTARWAKRGNQQKASQSAKSTVRLYDGAFSRAEQAIAEIKPILAPKLGFMEAFEAQRDLDTQMGRYRSLGPQLRAVLTALKT
jgi:succinate dehydrogenase flavin-adding protein (antitoxin of CptAB toxin-antitoxin module)